MHDHNEHEAETDLKEALDHLNKAEQDLAAARVAEAAAEEEIKEALEEIQEVESHHHERHFEIIIDRKNYRVEKEEMTGTELRALPVPPIGADRDLFEVVPSGPDRKIEDQESIEMRNGLRFFTAPAHINPGRVRTRYC